MTKKKDKQPNLQELEQKVKELTDALQHERADSINLRRRHDEQIASLKTLVQADVVRQLLPVIDNFERSVRHVPKELEGNTYVKGIQGVIKQFEQVLERIGVKRIKTIGEIFDPRYHEAVSVEDGRGDAEVISEELQPGYCLGDTVIRHAMVKVQMTNRKEA